MKAKDAIKGRTYRQKTHNMVSLGDNKWKTWILGYDWILFTVSPDIEITEVSKTEVK